MRLKIVSGVKGYLTFMACGHILDMDLTVEDKKLTCNFSEEDRQGITLPLSACFNFLNPFC